MPALHTSLKPAEEGWSKQHEEDLVERTFMATFAAFKFPDRERLHVSCGVQLCRGKCPNVSKAETIYICMYICICSYVYPIQYNIYVHRDICIAMQN